MEILEKDFGIIAEREVINRFKEEVKEDLKQLETKVSSTSSSSDSDTGANDPQDQGNPDDFDPDIIQAKMANAKRKIQNLLKDDPFDGEEKFDQN